MGLPSLRALDGAQAARIWLAVEATDMRCGFDRLAERVQAVIGENPLSGHLFVFRSRRGDRLKILAWDRDGFVLWYKRLEKGVFRLPRGERGSAGAGAVSQRVGNLTSKTDRRNQLIPFDNMGRLIGTTTSYTFLPGRNFTTSYTYDKASNRTGFTDPEGGSTTYVYDTLNRLQPLTPPTAFGSGSFGFSYDALSRRTQMTRLNNVTTNYAYDNLSRLTSVLHQLAGSTIDGATYTLDNAANRTAKTDQRTAVATSYGYDNIYQLLSATQGTTTTESYTYDPVGNRTASLGVASYTTNSSNEMTANSNASYTYDYNGNTLTSTTGSNTTTYAWDFENRLTSVTLPGTGGTVTFKYDPFGRRIYKSSTSGTSVFAYDGDNLVEETNATGAVVARYAQTTNVDEPLAMLRGGATSFYQTDGLGSISSLANVSGVVAQTYTYDSFGKATASSGTLTNPVQFTAREFDAESGLYFLRNRYYDPQAGRFLNEDPLRFGGDDANFYAYVQNSPVDSVDPFGLQHTPGGPWHPDPGVKFACKWTDSCSALSAKIGIFKSLIAGHIAFDIATNQPGRHSEDIATFTNGLANCITIHKAKCTNKQCPPEDTPVPVPVPQREPFRVPAPTPQAAANAVAAVAVIGIIIIAIILSPVGI